jgi:hypothetical protein
VARTRPPTATTPIVVMVVASASLRKRVKGPPRTG